MSEFKIEKGVAPPPPRASTAWHPFGLMEVGDSVFIPVKSGRNTPMIRRAAGNFGRSKGWKFTTREQSGGVRVWRLA